MRPSTLVVIAFLSTSSVLTVDPAQAEVVSFGLPAYAELGGVRAEVSEAFTEVQLAQTNLTASLNYISLTLNALSTASATTNIPHWSGDLSTAASALSTINSAVGAQSLADLASSLSPLDTSNIRSGLQNISSGLSNVNAGTSNPIEPPTLQLYYAVAVSGRARAEAEQLRTEVIDGQARLASTGLQLLDVSDKLAALSSNLSSANAQVLALERKIGEALNEAPALAIVLNSMLTTALALEADLTFLQSEVSSVRNGLNESITRVSARFDEIEQVISSIDYALTASPLPANWNTSSQGVSSGYFSISMEGRAFTSPYTEIDGPFLLGTMSVYNPVVFLPVGTTTATIRFDVLRKVNDPILGLVETGADASINMSYVTTPNITGDPIASADYFQVPALGINVYILEETVARFSVYGQYDSPLRIVSIVPEDDGGFVSPTVPEPASIAIWTAMSLLAAATRWRRTSGWV